MTVSDEPRYMPLRVTRNDRIADGIDAVGIPRRRRQDVARVWPAPMSRFARQTASCANIRCATIQPSATAIWSRSSVRPTAAAAPST